MFVQVFKAAGVDPHSCQCGGVQAKGLRYLGMAGVGAFTIPYVNDNVGIVS